MKKTIYYLLAFILAGEIAAEDNGAVDLSDSLRDITGKVEELEKTVSEMQKKISLLEEMSNNKTQEEVAQKAPNEVIKTACGMMEENNRDGARKILNSFITQNPTNVYCGMMLFYVGNSYFSEEDYKNAAMAYMKGFKKNPTGSKAAETLYKLALCFKQLQKENKGKYGDKYKSTLQKIISDYPGEFADKASLEIKKIK